MNRKYIILALLFTSLSYGQEKEPIATDRPDQTETPAIVPKGMFQMENGFSYEKNNSHEDGFVLPSSLLKYGLNDNFELRLILEYSTSKLDGQTISGLNPVLVGMKVKICDEKGIIPKTSLIGHVLLPNLASNDLKADHVASTFRFTMQHSLTDKISLGYNLGAEWDGITPDATFIYTLTTGFALSEKSGAYVELYGFAPEQDIAYHSFDGGFTYLLSNNFMLDVSGGFGLTEEAPDYFGALGFSFRL